MIFNRPTRAIPNTAYLKNQAKLQHCDDQLTLSSPHHISFPIQRGIVFAMASRGFTVDSAKKKEFINIFLLMPESSVLNAMRQATFTEEDIANLQMWRFLQRALPGGSIKGLRAYIAGLLPLPPHCHDRRQKWLVDDLSSTRMDHLVAASSMAATKPATRGCLQVMATPSQSLAKKRKQIRNRHYYSKKVARASPPSAKTATPHLDVTPPPVNNDLKMLTNAATTLVIAATALISNNHWALNANDTMRTPSARRVAKHRQVMPAVDGILRAGNVV